MVIRTTHEALVVAAVDGALEAALGMSASVRPLQTDAVRADGTRPKRTRGQQARNMPKMERAQLEQQMRWVLNLDITRAKTHFQTQILVPSYCVSTESGC
jgi:hypothetical protein